jgi:hypothetical protein
MLLDSYEKRRICNVRLFDDCRHDFNRSAVTVRIFSRHD